LIIFTLGFTLLFLLFSWNYLNSYIKTFIIFSFINFLFVYSYTVFSNPGLRTGLNKTAELSGKYRVCNQCNILIDQAENVSHCALCEVCIEGELYKLLRKPITRARSSLSVDHKMYWKRQYYLILPVHRVFRDIYYFNLYWNILFCLPMTPGRSLDYNKYNFIYSYNSIINIYFILELLVCLLFAIL